MHNTLYMSLFGDWMNNLEHYKTEFSNGVPFKNVSIPNFLSEDTISKVVSEFPCDFDTNKNWFNYENPAEVKYLNSNIKELPPTIKSVYDALSSNEMVNAFAEISSIDTLEYDPTLYGSSIHAHGRYGRLHLHLDYEKHPILENKERRLNLILYLNENWDSSWNGQTELWNEDVTECVKKHEVTYNTATLFQTNNMSWHGVPEKILCPPDVFRKTLAYYYISPLVTEPGMHKYGVDSTGYRTKASFVKRPQDKESEGMKKLYEIRPKRRIETGDIWEGWNKKTD